MSRPLDAAKADSIIQSAVDVFGAKGFTEASIKEIAERAGVAAGTVYTYYSDKEKLFTAAVEWVWEGFHRESREILARAASLEGKLEALVAYALPLLRNLYPLVRGMFGQARRLDLVNQQLDVLAEQFFRLFREQGYLVEAENDLGSSARDIFRLWLSGFLFMLANADPDNLDQELQKIGALVHYFLGTIPSPSPNTNPSGPLSQGALR